MKTINLSIPEEIWRLARIEAAKHNTSLSGLVRAYLRAMVEGKVPVVTETTNDESDRDDRLKLLRALQSTDLTLGYKPSRAKTHER